MVTVALVTPLTMVGVPMEQTAVLAESTESATVSPEVDCAPTVKAPLKLALAGAVCVKVIAWPNGTVGVSTRVTVSATLIVMVAEGAGGAAVVAVVVLNASDCVKLDPDDVLVKLLNCELSVNVIVPAGVPLAGEV